jgi:hypothetical protein
LATYVRLRRIDDHVVHEQARRQALAGGRPWANSPQQCSAAQRRVR